MKHILLIEDDQNICELLAHLLTNRYQLDTANSGTEALMQISKNKYDLILLDLMLPGVTGESVLEMVRRTSHVPIIIITALNDKSKTVNLLRKGANDYITKPFHVEELEARIEVQLRNTALLTEPGDELSYHNLTLIREEYKVLVHNQDIQVSHKEYKLLELLLLHPKKIYSKANLYQTIWENDYFGGENTINVHISTLRKKLKDADPDTEYIETIWGLGIRLAGGGE